MSRKIAAPSTSRQSFYWLAPSSVFFLIFLGVPLVVLALYSVWSVVDYRVIVDWNLENYKYLLTTPSYLVVALRTAGIAAGSTLMILLISLPIVYWLCRYVDPRRRRILLVVIILPLATSYLLRVYAWLNLLGDQGLINQILLGLHVVSSPVRILYNPISVSVVLIYLYLPFGILTLFVSMEHFDWDLLKAAQDLGARPFKALIVVLLPSLRAGFATSAIVVAIPILGEYLTPQIIGGVGGSMIGNTVVNFFQSAQYTRGSALGILIMVVVLAVLVPARRSLSLNTYTHG